MNARLLPRVILAALALFLGACASNPQESAPQASAGDYPDPVFTAKRTLPPEGFGQTEIYDPFEGINKRIYNFNYHFDQYIFLPAVRGYEYVVPGFARTGVHNFFENFDDMITILHSLLQLSPTKAMHSTGRVLVNSTVGILGLIDVATMLDIPKYTEDMGQTLGYWGVGQGPYIVIPFIGPSNLRDGIGMLPDYYVRTLIHDELFSSETQLFLDLMWALDTRSNTSFRYYETGSAYEYGMVRWLWSTKRELDVMQ